MSDHKKLTNEVGAPVADNENAITAGPRGPVVMQDVWLMEKMALSSNSDLTYYALKNKLID